MDTFHNDDAALLENVERVLGERSRAGLDGLVGGLEAIVVNTEPENFAGAVAELLRYTGYDTTQGFSAPGLDTAVMSLSGSADILITRRKGGDNPFLPFNAGIKVGDRLGTRLETFIFSCHDLERYAAIQKGCGVRFLTPDIVRAPGYDFLQTAPSAFTGNSIGLIQRKDRSRGYAPPGSTPLSLDLVKPASAHLANIGRLDHVATRVKAQDRDPAILEFLSLTNYHFDFAVYVESLNSITSVARLGAGDYAQVFTSGITPFTTPESSGPTEMFIHNWGLRAHHMALETEDIDAVVEALRADGMRYISDLVGSREEGLKQVFTVMSPTTFLVTEYIKRFDGFDGFFTKSNVTHLTKATEKQ
ncbi:hypothetical protein G3N56_17085 [Desulfovibrio sulfodismutans]|uniref:VOC domain-containing protein n=1 Tax=Desulfolutivibrio sulfodismutans TaxID=63561 RepID=A0A7K3NQG3_9BACT|nr:hypothetical protein [Desulfolutivibrio sulfodismutans]NDY58450.1 hypothetical protein [Desulfolutivibrio sulfodismutans]QLA10846.1 hypothetical protein GD606_00400 [Desulfolutivibrio sulfodismutans DSM 3696]